jgi:hypothetical protein
MTFIRSTSKSYRWPVTVEEPVDGGEWKEQGFTAVFKRLGRSEFNKLTELGDEAVIQEILEGWDDLKEESGEAIAYTPEAVAEMSNDTYWSRGVIKAYFEFLNGGKEKN